MGQMEMKELKKKNVLYVRYINVTWDLQLFILL